MERLMYNKIYDFIEKKKRIHIFTPIRFLIENSTCLAQLSTLIHLADKIRNEIDKGNNACVIFVDFQNNLK